MNQVSGMCQNGESVLEQFQVQVQGQERQRFRVEEFRGARNAWNRISLLEELSRAGRIRVEFEFKVEFDIQNAESYMTLGT